MDMEKLLKYKVWIFDLDGTLYNQTPVRIEMALQLIAYYICRPFKIRELLMLRQYRKIREKLYNAENPNFHQLQIKEMSRRYNMNVEKVMKIIDYWLINRPLSVIRRWRRSKVLSAIKLYQARGIEIIVYSDYPVSDKLKALNVQPNYSYWSNDELIRCMKPNPKGLRNIIKQFNLTPQEFLYIGDRDDRDGQCARQVGIDYLDINDFEKFVEV